MICSEVVDLLLVESHPEILADEFHEIEFILKPWTVSRYPNNGTIKSEKYQTNMYQKSLF